MTTMLLVLAALWTGDAGAVPSAVDRPSPGKLAPAVSKEMTEAIVSLNKTLGLESWPARGFKPCLDRGGQGILAKEVTPEDTKKCAAATIAQGLPGLGKTYVLAIPMASIGPVTVIAFGIGDSLGWAAYSCDPERKCLPVKLSAPTKWGKRMAERQQKACADGGTLWFPEGQKSCP
jgi:hypothetical protein